jgi:hypothetical protein
MNVIIAVGYRPASVHQHVTASAISIIGAIHVIAIVVTKDDT